MRNRYLLSLLLIGTLLLTPFAGAKAEDTPSFELDQVVVTATKTPVKLAEAGANISVITKEEIEKMHYRSVADALRNVPGVNVTDYGYPGSESNIWLNGSNKVIILIDGKKVNLPNSASVDLANLVGTENIEAIEVIKGGSSALYGADAVGGVVNILTKRGKENKNVLSIAGGSWGSYSYSISNQGQEQDLSWYVTGKDEHFGDYKTADGDVRKNSSYNAKSLTLRLDKKLADGGSLTFSHQHYSNQKSFPGSINTGSLSDWGNNVQHSWGLTYSSNPQSKFTNELSLYQNIIHDYAQQGNYNDNNMRTQGIGYQVNIQINEKHLLTSGLEWRKEKMVNENYIEGKTKENKNTALYLQDQWKVNEKLSLTSGIRFDHHEAYGHNTTPRFVLNYKENPKTNYYISWGKFFRAPTFIDLYSPENRVDDPLWPYIYTGNPGLKPEKGWNKEFGVNHKFDSSLEFKYSYFERQVNDAITLDDSIRNIGGTDYHVYSMSNVDKQKAQGWNIQLNKHFTPQLSSFVGCSYLSVKNKGKDDEDYIKDKNAPERTWNLGLNYTKESYNVQLKGRGIENRPGKNDKLPQASYWVWDTCINVKVKPELNVFLKVNNLFNENYAEQANNKSNYWPAAGRNYLFGVDYSF